MEPAVHVINDSLKCLRDCPHLNQVSDITRSSPKTTVVFRYSARPITETMSLQCHSRECHMSSSLTYRASSGFVLLHGLLNGPQWISLLKTPVALFTRTCRTTPSQSGKVSWTNVWGHWPRGRFVSFVMTKSQTLKFRFCFSHCWRLVT